MNMQKLARISFVFVALIMFYFSSQPGEESNYVSDSVAEMISIKQDGSGMHISVQSLLLGLNLRKMAHIGIFATLSVLAYLSQNFYRSTGKKALVSVFVSYSYACFDEIHQTFVPERAGSFGDTLIDLMGVLLGLLFITVLWDIYLSKRFLRFYRI